MRLFAIAAFLLACALPALAAVSPVHQKVTVEQLAKTLSESKGKSDAEVADALASLELTERLSTARFANLKAEMPGDLSRQALTALTDASEFLKLPATEIPVLAAPNPAAQKQMMALVVAYVTKTTHQLPNLFATRDTTRFEDRPQQDIQQDTGLVSVSYLPLHFVAKSSTSVVYRDGQEVVDAGEGKTKKLEPGAQGLVSYGEFGPILSTVLLDAAQSKLTWSHWEPGADGPEAVFGFAVPAQKSHYWVQFCCVADQSGDGLKTQVFRERAGYHGEMAVDPATGTILRVAAEAELALGEPLTEAAMMVEYGPVQIGGKSFVCPEKSVALSLIHFAAPTGGMHSAALDRGPIKTLLNHVQFEQYHQLRAETRILTEDAATPDSSSSAQTTADATPAVAPPAPPAATSETKSAPAQVAANEAPAPLPPAISATANAASAPATTEPEISIGEASGMPDAPTNASTRQQSPYVLKLNARLVDVGAVVTDKRGRTIKDMKPDDFDLYDNGRKQQIKFFSVIMGESATAMAPTPAPEATTNKRFNNQPANGTVDGYVGATTLSDEANVTVLLFDESHIAFGDLTNARAQVIKFLKGLAPGERVALYTMTALNFRVMTEITGDHEAIVAKLSKWMPSAQSLGQAQDEETRNRQQIDEVHSVSDLNSVNGNHLDLPDFSSPVDPQLLTMGSNPGRASLIILNEVARHLAAVPGHKTLVWISTDNVFADFSDQSVGTDKNTTSIDSYALHAQEAMNDAHVSVYPFDVSQLEAGDISADMQHRNVQLNQAAGDAAGAGGGAGGPSGGDDAMGMRDSRAGRIKAEMSQDLHPIQGPIRQVAEATGGRTVRRSGDLAAALKGIVDEGHATYLLSFYPDTAADGKYHNINLKLQESSPDHRGLAVRYRTGYFFAKDGTTMKDRIQQAIWQPMDTSEIKVSAAVAGEKSDANLKITIAANDLGLEQQAGRWMDKIDVFFIQRDDAGLHAQVDGQTLALRLTPATYQSVLTEGIPLDHPGKLGPQVGSIRVLVVDENSGRMGSVTIPAAALGSVH